MRLRAFEAWRPTEPLAHKIASPPYDVVTTEEARNLVRDNSLSMLRIVRAEVDLPPETDPFSDAVYETAFRNFDSLKENGTLIRDSEPCLFLYQQQMGSHTQCGVVALCHVEDYESDLIKKHENTRQDKEDDRTRLMNDLSADPGPVFLTYRDQPEIDTIVSEASNASPLYNFTAEDGIRHSVWRLSRTDDLVAAFQAVPHLYVADGHHRTAGAARVGKLRRSANPNHTGSEDYNWFLSVLFPADQLMILPYNRIIRNLNGLSEDDFLNKVEAACELRRIADPKPAHPGSVCMYLGREWYQLQLGQPDGDDPVSRLDMSILERRVLTPILGIDDQRSSSNIDFVGGADSVTKLVSKVDSREAAVAFSLYPVTVNQLMDIADSGRNMPPKTTWFEPKLRSGLFIHTF